MEPLYCTYCSGGVPSLQSHRHLWSAEAVDFGEEYLPQVSRGKVSNKVDQNCSNQRSKRVILGEIESRPTVPKFDNQQIRTRHWPPVHGLTRWTTQMDYPILTSLLKFSELSESGSI